MANRQATIGHLLTCLLVLAALACRLVDFTTIPGLGGDEAWYGVQMGRFVSGRDYLTRTPTGLPLNPFFAWWEAPTLWAFPPSVWMLRLPAFASGLLAIVAADRLLAKPLGSTQARIAALGLAVLPVAVLFSRLGWDQSQAPLFGVLAVAAALRGEPIFLMLAAYAYLWVHPVNAIALPAAALPFLVVGWRRWPDRRIWVVAGTVLLTFVLVRMAQQANTQPVLLAPRESLFTADRWAEFLVRLGRFLSGDAIQAFYVNRPMPGRTLARDVFAATSAIGLLLPGSWALVQRRRWDQLALVVGTLVAIFGFGVVAGPNGLKPELIRYPMALVGPVVASSACLLGSLLPEDPRWRRRMLVALWGIAWLPLIDFQAGFLMPMKIDGGDGPPAYRAGAIDPKRAAFDRILADRVDKPDGPRDIMRETIYSEDYWIHTPIAYYALRTPSLYLHIASSAPAGLEGELKRALPRGATFLAFAGSRADEQAQALFPADRLERRVVSDYGGRPAIAVYRLRP